MCNKTLVKIGMVTLSLVYIMTFNYGGCGVNDTVVGSGSNNNTLSMQSAPSVTTNPATNITRISATLNAIINPNGVATTSYFNYGLTPSYTVATASHSIGDCNSVQPWDTISGLLPNTLYYFRIVATNAIGTTYGNNLTFTTAEP